MWRSCCFEVLCRARELYRQKQQANATVDQLASLFAQCAIDEARPISSGPPPLLPPLGIVDPAALLDANDASILAQSGRKQIMLDAFADGSSFICLRCGGLVSSSRKDEHVAYWCGNT
uniref:C2HC zinc finger plants domain-containing protein n=1 Tax=Ananas comosus var. bracteatus TaxID=296719 RepID=A0A6V7NF67_ANACO|nr:unnamed protein product [Ananas comosus var. bracteatus]